MLQSPAKIDSVAANVNGEQIDLNEVLFEMMNERTSVYTEFAEKHQLGEDPLRWEKKYEGKRPISILRERALKNAIRTKIIQIQMKKFGIQADISYSNFNKNFESFTQSRGSANQAVYGPPHLSPSNFITITFLATTSSSCARNSLKRESIRMNCMMPGLTSLFRKPALKSTTAMLRN
jgi:hypothetical protein